MTVDLGAEVSRRLEAGEYAEAARALDEMELEVRVRGWRTADARPRPPTPRSAPPPPHTHTHFAPHPPTPPPATQHAAEFASSAWPHALHVMAHVCAFQL